MNGPNPVNNMTRLCQMCGRAVPFIPDGVFRDHDCPAMPDTRVEYSFTVVDGVEKVNEVKKCQ